MSEWIDVMDKVPTVESGEMKSDLIKVMTDCGDEYYTRYSRVSGFDDYYVTHWKYSNEGKN